MPGNENVLSKKPLTLFAAALVFITALAVWLLRLHPLSKQEAEDIAAERFGRYCYETHQSCDAFKLLDPQRFGRDWLITYKKGDNPAVLYAITVHADGDSEISSMRDTGALSDSGSTQQVNA